jgi:hypothetical protein
MVVKLESNANNIKGLLREQACGDGGIDSARHGDKDAWPAP